MYGISYGWYGILPNSLILSGIDKGHAGNLTLLFVFVTFPPETNIRFNFLFPVSELTPPLEILVEYASN